MKTLLQTTLCVALCGAVFGAAAVDVGQAAKRLRELGARLTARNARLTALALGEPSLEDVFIKLMSDAPDNFVRDAPRQLAERGAQVIELPHSGGHQIDPAVLPQIRSLIRREP